MGTGYNYFKLTSVYPTQAETLIIHDMTGIKIHYATMNKQSFHYGAWEPGTGSLTRLGAGRQTSS
jgi:hypothetical protein